jgi:hypothetical protein
MTAVTMQRLQQPSFAKYTAGQAAGHMMHLKELQTATNITLGYTTVTADRKSLVMRLHDMEQGDAEVNIN